MTPEQQIRDDAAAILREPDLWRLHGFANDVLSLLDDRNEAQRMNRQLVAERDQSPERRHERDYLERTIATVRNHRESDNCWPQWANIFADEIEALWAERDRLVAERDEARHSTAVAAKMLQITSELLLAAVKREAALREALTPFAAAHNWKQAKGMKGHPPAIGPRELAAAAAALAAVPAADPTTAGGGDMSGEPTGWCLLCEPLRRVAASALLEHMRVVHDLDAEPATWPDGELVIVDQTLEPDDFGGGGS